MLKPYLLLLYTLTLVMFSMAKKPFVPGHLLCLLNKERLAENLPPVHANSLLDLAAQKHSEEQAFYRDMTHDGKDGSSPSDRVSRANYHWNHVGECIAAGYRTMKRVVKAWMNSPGHRRIIMSRSYKEVGIGYARSIDGAPYWTLDFGSRSGPIPGWPNPTEGCPSSTPTDPVIEAQNQTAHSPIPTTLETCQCQCPRGQATLDPSLPSNGTYRLSEHLIQSILDPHQPRNHHPHKDLSFVMPFRSLEHGAISFWSYSPILPQ